jgi:hypothetical protein
MLYLIVLVKIVNWLAANPIYILYIIGGYFCLMLLIALLPRLCIAAAIGFPTGAIIRLAIDTAQLEFLQSIPKKTFYTAIILGLWLLLGLIHLINKKLFGKQRQSVQPVPIGFMSNENMEYDYGNDSGYKIPIGFSGSTRKKRS